MLVRESPPIGARSELLAALKDAVEPGSSPQVLVVVGFVGLRELLEMTSEPVAFGMIDWLGGLLARILGERGRVFRSRRGELTALIAGDGETAAPLIAAVTAELDESIGFFRVRTAVGTAALPDEATSAIYALGVADHRLRALSGNLRPDPRPTGWNPERAGLGHRSPSDGAPAAA